MDTSDPDIRFDADGVCNHCTGASLRLERFYFPDERGSAKLERLTDKIKQSGRGKEFDCLIGISGGLDSSWLTYKSKDWGLRPFIFHVDAGWDSEVAKANIEKILTKLGYPLFTYTVDWEEMRDLQRAYLESSLSNQDVPQDHVFFSVLYNKTKELGLKYWLSGSNLVSESILPSAWGQSAMDAKQLKAIHRRFGQAPLHTYKTLRFHEWLSFHGNFPLLSPVISLTPLNLMPYNVVQARETLVREVGWQDYGRKHSESLFTKFFQNYYLPKKFGFDKRRAHLSSLIVAGETDRAFALKSLCDPLYDDVSLQRDKETILSKLGYEKVDWDRLMNLPNKSVHDYPNWESYLKIGIKVKRFLRRLGLDT